MRNLLALVYFLLALIGCDGGGTTWTARASLDGQDVLHARTRLHAGVARFECIASASGRCHYALFAQACAPQPAACQAAPFERFSLAVGESREVVGLPDRFQPCAGTSDAIAHADCREDAAAQAH